MDGCGLSRAGPASQIETDMKKKVHNDNAERNRMENPPLDFDRV
jgi:hypothetical protein